MAISENWSRENLAWAGGLFEGEGSITHRYAREIFLRLVTTDKDVIDRFHCIIGLGVTNGPYLYTDKAKCQAVIAALWPYLGTRRKERAEQMSALAASTGPLNKHKKQCPRGHLYDEENTYLDARGSRCCRACSREKQRKYTQEKKALKNVPEHLRGTKNGGSESPTTL